MFVCLVCATTALPALIMELGDYDTLAHARSRARAHAPTHARARGNSKTLEINQNYMQCSSLDALQEAPGWDF